MEYVLSILDVPQDGLKKLAAPFLALGQHVHDHFIPNARNNYHPHILGHRALALMSALLLTARIFTLGVLAFGPIEPAFSSAITEANIIALTNESRIQNGEALLNENSELDVAAQNKANDMLAKGYFAHNTPSGQTPWDFITAAGYSYLMAGENLAVNFTQAEDVETAWMNSPEHRANLLNKNFEDIGIGISQGEYEGHNAIFVVQEFGTPAAQQITLNNTPTQVQTAPAPAPAAASTPAPKPAVKNLQPPLTQVRGDSSAAPPASAAANSAITPAPAASSTQSASAAASIGVASGNVTLDGDNVDITAQTVGAPVKVLAYFGQQAIMLSPKGNNTWTGTVAVSVLAQQSVTVKLEAFDINNQTASMQLADFAPSTMANFNVANTAPTNYINFFGYKFDPRVLEGQFYLLFIAVLLSCLVLAIAIKRHVQHLSLIANSSFVVILATLLWWVR